MKRLFGKKIWNWIPGVLVSGIALFVLSRFINFNELSAAIRKFTPVNVIVIIILILLPLCFRALAWKSFLREVTFKNSFLMVNEGYFLSNLIPRSGEVARIFLAKSTSGIDAFHSAAAIIFERGLDVVIAAGLFLSTLPLVIDMEWMRPMAFLLMIVFCSMIIGMVLVAIYADRLENWISNKPSRLSFIERSIKPVIIRAIHGLTSLAKPKNLLLGIFWILCSWFLWTSLLFYGLKIIDPNAPVWWAVFAEGVLALGIALPSAPASLGVYEGTMVIALSVLGIDNNSALSTAIILHSLQILITTLLGIAGLAVHGLSLADVIKNISNRLKKKTKR